MSIKQQNQLTKCGRTQRGLLGDGLGLLGNGQSFAGVTRWRAVSAGLWRYIPEGFEIGHQKTLTYWQKPAGWVFKLLVCFKEELRHKWKQKYIQSVNFTQQTLFKFTHHIHGYHKFWALNLFKSTQSQNCSYWLKYVHATLWKFC